MPVISTNTAANTAVRFLNINSDDQSNSLAKLASGSNINKASDDAAGLAIATKIGTDVAALEQASTNASHGISVLQTADGGASNISDIVQRMKVLASESSSGTVTDNERAYIQAEFSQLQDEIDGITESTRYNGQSLLDGSSDFSVDDVETAATAGGETKAVATGIDTYDSGAAAVQTATLTIDNIDVDLTTSELTSGNQGLTGQQIADAINTAMAESDKARAADIVADVDSSGNVIITDLSGLDMTLSITGDLAMADLALDDDGATVTAGVTSATAYSDAAATEAATGTIMIDGTKVTLTSDYDAATTTASLSVADMVNQINEGLQEAGNYQITAELSSDSAIVLTSIESGENASITLSNYDIDGGLSLSTLGLASGSYSGTTTESETTGAEIVVGSTSADTINLSIESLTTEALGIEDLDVSTQEGAAQALSVLDSAIDTISDARAQMGATMSRFEFRSAQIDTSVENLEAAESAIADVDIAKEQAQLSSASVRVQAAVAAASQANEMPNNLMSLLQ